MNLPFSNKAFDKAVQAIVAAIEPGRVMSYAEVARRAGYPRHARMVSKAMSRSDSQLPWHRVVRSDRKLGFKPGSDAYQEQKRLLQKEGVRLVNGKAVVSESETAVDLDRLLWGPP